MFKLCKELIVAERVEKLVTLNMFGIVDSVEFILSVFIMSSIMLFFGNVSRDVDLVAKIETVLAGMPTEEVNSIHADLSSIIHRRQAPKPNCTRNQIAALKSLQQNDKIIIILPADKGRATVIQQGRLHQKVQ